RRVLIINRLSSERADELLGLARDLGLEVAGTVPDDPLVFQYDLEGRPVYQLPADSAAVVAVFSILDGLRIP
ncbi:MAG: hypothetical protein D6778_09045, partial [Nitrospirae bacterium]